MFDVRWSLVAQAIPDNELFLSKRNRYRKLIIYIGGYGHQMEWIDQNHLRQSCGAGPYPEEGSGPMPLGRVWLRETTLSV